MHKEHKEKVGVGSAGSGEGALDYDHVGTMKHHNVLSPRGKNGAASQNWASPVSPPRLSNASDCGGLQFGVVWDLKQDSLVLSVVEARGFLSLFLV